MADFMTQAERSRWMANIRGKDTKPELIVRKFLHGQGLRFRLHASELPGRPDLVLPKYRAVVFVEGCFWHGHICQRKRIPKGNSVFWATKIATNKARDRRNQRALRADGWRVMRVWECQLSTKARRERALSELVGTIKALSAPEPAGPRYTSGQ